MLSTLPLGQTLTVTAYLVGIIAFWCAARRRQLATEGVAYLALAALIGGVVGAKIGEWAISSGALWGRQAFAIFDVQSGGRTILGGVLGGWLAVEMAKKRLAIRRSTGDVFAFALPWGEAVGRIGCWFNGCCFGALWDGPCAVWQHGGWRYPTQFLSAIAAAGIGLVLWAGREHWQGEGVAWHLYLALWGASRFVIEFAREHPQSGTISTAQWIALAIAAIGVVLLRRDGQRQSQIQPSLLEPRPIA